MDDLFENIDDFMSYKMTNEEDTETEEDNE